MLPNHHLSSHLAELFLKHFAKYQKKKKIVLAIYFESTYWTVEKTLVAKAPKQKLGRNCADESKYHLTLNDMNYFFHKFSRYSLRISMPEYSVAYSGRENLHQFLPILL